MKRTAEITLSIIGAVSAILGIILFNAIKKFLLIDEVVEEFVQELNADLAADGVESIDGAQLIGGMSVFSNIGIILFITALIIGIIAALLFKGNKRPKIASILLIVTAVVVTLGTIFIGVITGILLLIPGIMGLVRKPKLADYLNNEYHTDPDTNIENDDQRFPPNN